MVFQAFTVHVIAFICCFSVLQPRERKSCWCWGRACSCCQPLLLLCSPSMCLVWWWGVTPSASLAVKISRAFRSLHELNPSAVGAGVKEGPVQWEVRPGTVLFSDSVAWIYLRCSCTCISRDLEQPAKARGGEVTGGRSDPDGCASQPVD